MIILNGRIFNVTKFPNNESFIERLHRHKSTNVIQFKV